jgi:hypothetical protein
MAAPRENRSAAIVSITEWELSYFSITMRRASCPADVRSTYR